MQHEDDILLGLSQLGPLGRMAPQPQMMSDLCSSHQSVATQTVQKLYNCDFSISVVTGTKSPQNFKNWIRNNYTYNLENFNYNDVFLYKNQKIKTFC